MPAQMRIVTHPSSNMDAMLAERLDVDLLPVHLAVDGALHDLCAPLPPALVQTCTRATHPSPVEIGAGPTDLVRTLCELGQVDPELLVVTAHQAVMKTFEAAMLAVASIAHSPSVGHLRVRVVSSRSADLGAGIMTMLASEARAHGLGLDAVADLLEGVAEHSVWALAPSEVGSFVTMGVTDRVRARFGRRPIVSSRDGALGVVDHYRSSEGPVPALLGRLAGLRGRQVWMGIAHTEAEDLAGQLEAQIRNVVSVQHLSQTIFGPLLAMRVEAGSVGVFAVPVDELGFAARSPSLRPALRRAA